MSPLQQLHPPVSSFNFYFKRTLFIQILPWTVGLKPYCRRQDSTRETLILELKLLNTPFLAFWLSPRSSDKVLCLCSPCQGFMVELLGRNVLSLLLSSHSKMRKLD